MAGASFTRGGIQDKVAQKASDPKFRQELLANPKASLEKVLGAEIPSGVNVKVLESPEGTHTVDDEEWIFYTDVSDFAQEMSG